MADIKFRDTAHRDFFLENMMKCRVNDCYHRAFFYVMGIASETRANINQMFNFKEVFPVRIILSFSKKRSMPSYATHILQAFFANSLLVTPA